MTGIHNKQGELALCRLCIEKREYEAKADYQNHEAARRQTEMAITYGQVRPWYPKEVSEYYRRKYNQCRYPDAYTTVGDDDD